MSKDVLTVASSQSLAEAAQVMVDRNVGAAVVVDDGALAGIITERDLLRAVARSLVPWTTTVAECMTRDPVTIEPTATVEHALEELMTRGFRHLPVVRDGDMIGIVSLRDLVGDRDAGT